MWVKKKQKTIKQILDTTQKVEAKMERTLVDEQDVGGEVEDGKRDGTKAEKHAEPVVTSLKKHKHTQVNYYPYKSVTTARHQTTTT